MLTTKTIRNTGQYGLKNYVTPQIKELQPLRPITSKLPDNRWTYKRRGNNGTMHSLNRVTTKLGLVEEQVLFIFLPPSQQQQGREPRQHRNIDRKLNINQCSPSVCKLGNNTPLNQNLKNVWLDLHLHSCTCKDLFLHLNDDLSSVDVHAEMDEGEHGHVHEDALDQQRGLVMATKPRWKFQIL